MCGMRCSCWDDSSSIVSVFAMRSPLLLLLILLDGIIGLDPSNENNLVAEGGGTEGKYRDFNLENVNRIPMM